MRMLHPKMIESGSKTFGKLAARAEELLEIDRVTNFPTQREYHPQSVSNTTSRNIHIGQRKLLMSEIHFLTEVHRSNTAHAPMLCVYAGACPCTHIPVLLDMFPNVYFILIDPAFKMIQDVTHLTNPRVFTCAYNFDSHTVSAIKMWIENRHNGRHWVHHALNVLCGRLFHIARNGENLLFISDIRRKPYDDAYIALEMCKQESWFTDLGACAGLLKFRLPFTNKVTGKGMRSVKSLEGDLCLPIWGPPSTTECRLLVRKGALHKVYYPEDHEKTMAGFNSVNRPSAWYHHGCEYKSYDEFAQTIVLENYHRIYQHECVR
jgi:cap2 methyltransferase